MKKKKKTVWSLTSESAPMVCLHVWMCVYLQHGALYSHWPSVPAVPVPWSIQVEVRNQLCARQFNGHLKCAYKQTWSQAHFLMSISVTFHQQQMLFSESNVMAWHQSPPTSSLQFSVCGLVSLLLFAWVRCHNTKVVQLMTATLPLWEIIVNLLCLDHNSRRTQQPKVEMCFIVTRSSVQKSSGSRGRRELVS